VRDGGEVDGFHLHLEFPGDDARAVEQIVDELRLGLDAPLDRFAAALDSVVV